MLPCQVLTALMLLFETSMAMTEAYGGIAKQQVGRR
jgi:hypothetical protein